MTSRAEPTQKKRPVKRKLDVREERLQGWGEAGEEEGGAGAHTEMDSDSVSHPVGSNSLQPMDCSPPGSSVHGILQARRLEWVGISFSRASSQPRGRTQVFYIVGRFFFI